MKLKSVFVYAHASDSQSYSFVGENREEIAQHTGYAPFIKNLCGGDDVDFEIDNATGKIIGWVPITDDQLEEILEDM